MFKGRLVFLISRHRQYKGQAAQANRNSLNFPQLEQLKKLGSTKMQHVTNLSSCCSFSIGLQMRNPKPRCVRNVQERLRRKQLKTGCRHLCGGTEVIKTQRDV